MIEINDLTKIFKTKKQTITALNNINLTFPDTGLVFILGKSGCGKSTFLNLLANFDTPTKGIIKYNNLDLSTLKEKDRDEYLFNEVGFVFQSYNLFSDLTVKENIALGLKTKSEKNKQEIDNILKLVELDGYQEKLVKKLSGGEKQRIVLARALIKNPSVILGDEPCGNLDNINSKKVLDIFKERSKTSLVILVTHNINDAYLYGDRVITLEEGEVAKDEVFDELNLKDDTCIIEDVNNLTKDECIKVSEGIKEGRINCFLPRKEFFVTFDKIIERNKQQINKEKKKGFFRSLLSNFKLINSKKAKVCAFSIFSALSLALFSTSYMMENFDEEKYFADTINSFDLNFNGFDKGFETSKDVDYSVAGKVNEEDYKYFKTNFGEEIYPRLALGFNTKESLYKLVRNDLLGYENYKGLFAQELNGVTLIDEKSLLKLLGEDELIYLAKSPIQFNDGIFITDYFADSLIMNSNFAYKNYDELINAYQDPFTAKERFNELKVNGVIKTNYKDKLEPFFKQIDDSKYVEEIITKKENIECYTYLYLVLNTAYSFNKNFVNDLKAPNQVFYKSLILENEVKEKVYENFQSYVTYSEALPSDTVLVSGNVFNNVYPNKTFDEIETLIKDKEFTLNKNIYSYEEPYGDVTQKVKVKIYELHKDKYKPVNNDITNNTNFMILPKKIHDNLYKSKAYTFGFLITKKGGKELYKGLVDRKFAMSSGITRVTSRTTVKIKEFSKVFKIFNIFSLILSLGILIYYACSVIKDNSYNVGVLKSLGYRGNELSAFYTISFISYSILTSILYIFSFYLLSKLVNNVLVDTLIKSSADLTYAEAIPIVDFNPILILFVCLMLLFITLVFSLIYLFILRKYKIIEVIQNEE